MKKSIEQALSKFTLNGPPDVGTLGRLQEKIDFGIDADYLGFIKTHNGGCGFLVNGNYLLFWSIDEVISLNPYFPEVPECDHLLFFASDGSSFGYAFDKKTGFIAGIEYLDISDQEPDVVARTFELFLST